MAPWFAKTRMQIQAMRRPANGNKKSGSGTVAGNSSPAPQNGKSSITIRPAMGTGKGNVNGAQTLGEDKAKAPAHSLDLDRRLSLARLYMRTWAVKQDLDPHHKGSE